MMLRTEQDGALPNAHRQHWEAIRLSRIRQLKIGSSLVQHRALAHSA
jgi:hypothetical protein